MTPDDFRRIALALERAVEVGHMGHPDFRVNNKIFATLGYPEPGLGMVKLTPEEQAMRVEAEPEVFRPVKGGWGARGATTVVLAAADEATLTGALTSAWRLVGPGAKA
jgi:hypothetical protein